MDGKLQDEGGGGGGVGGRGVMFAQLYYVIYFLKTQFLKLKDIVCGGAGGQKYFD